MGKKLLRLIFAVLCLLPVCVNATVVDFNDHQIVTIQANDNYDGITLHDFALVTMTGGSAQAIWSYDSSTFQMQGGEILGGGIYIWNSSNLLMSGGLIQGFEMHGGVASISGGNIAGYFGIFDSISMVHIYGKNFNLDFHINGWSIAGNWADNSQFTIFYRGGSPSLPPGSNGSPIALHTIPEPCSFLLLVCGVIFMKKFCVSS